LAPKPTPTSAIHRFTRVVDDGKVIKKWSKAWLTSGGDSHEAAPNQDPQRNQTSRNSKLPLTRVQSPKGRKRDGPPSLTATVYRR
jgi:hypothetical protein